MSKIFNAKLFSAGALISGMLFPQMVLAAQLSFELVPGQAGDQGAAIVQVGIDPEGKTLNVVEGVIVFETDGSSGFGVETETGGSVLTLWPIRPDYIPGEKAIRFTGGVPGGFNQKGQLFRMRLSSGSSTEAKINWVHGTAYLNDGKGTKEPVFAKSLTVNLTGQAQGRAGGFSQDVQPPSFDKIEIGQDKNSYDGRYFISFNAQDDISGVDRYEVKEGGEVTVVKNGVYVLKNQDRTTPVSITAYDKAGNKKVVSVPAKINWQKYIIILSIILLASAISLYVYKKRKK